MDIKLKKDSFLENIGVKYFEKLEKKSSALNRSYLDEIPSDKVLEAISNVIIKNATIIAFLIGAIVTIPLILFEVAYFNELSLVEFYIKYSFWAFLSLVIELILLYLLTLHSIYALLHLIGKYPQKESNLPEVLSIDRILIRSALELEEPILEVMGIDPRKKVSKQKLLIAAFLYKLKVIISTFIIKKLFKAILPRIGARGILVPFISVVVVAFWDGYVIYKSLLDAKLRLFGYYFSKYIIEQILLKKISKNKLLIKGAIRAIAIVMSSSKSNHPNNLILLVRLSSYLNKDIKDIDNLDMFLDYLKTLNKKEQHYLKLLATIAAIFDGKVTKEEKEILLKIYQDEKNYYLKLLKNMQNLLKKGHIHKLAYIVKQEFN